MMNFEVVETKQENAKIKVVGVGGGIAREIGRAHV